MEAVEEEGEEGEGEKGESGEERKPQGVRRTGWWCCWIR